LFFDLSNGLLHKNGQTSMNFGQVQIAIFIRNDTAGLKLTPLRERLRRETMYSVFSK